MIDTSFPNEAISKVNVSRAGQSSRFREHLGRPWEIEVLAFA